MGRQPAGIGMDDVERHARHGHGDPEILEKKSKSKADCFIWCIIGIIVVVPTCVLLWLVLDRLDAHYKVAIDDVSGLDPIPARGLSFNLTLGVRSSSYGAEACIQPGTYVEVSYGGVQLAASTAEIGRLCARPRKSAEQRVVARVTGVPVGQVLDSIAADMKRGAAVFDVTLHLPAGSYGVMPPYGGENWATECGGRQVGAAASWCPSPNQDPMFV
jgi:hypothetical protein